METLIFEIKNMVNKVKKETKETKESVSDQTILILKNALECSRGIEKSLSSVAVNSFLNLTNLLFVDKKGKVDSLKMNKEKGIQKF